MTTRLKRFQEFIQPPPHLLLRIFIFLFFITTLYGFEYDRVRDTGFAFDDVSRVRLTGTIRAANRGYPFYFFFGEGFDPGYVNPEYAFPWSNTADEYGIHLLVVSASLVGKAISGDDFLLDGRSPFLALFFLFSLTCFLFLLPAIPIQISLAGILTLWVGIIFGPIGLHTRTATWGFTYMSILVGMGIICAPLPKKGIATWIFWIGMMYCVLVASYIRQAGTVAVYTGSLGLLITAGLIACTGWYVLRERNVWQPYFLTLARRVSITSLFLILPILLAPYILKAAYSMAYDTPYRETVVTQHGAGLPLYVGLGYISNDYNITWYDLAGEVQSQLYAPGVPISHASVEFQSTLTDAFLEIMKQQPWFMLQNFQAKVGFIHHYLLTGSPPYESAFLYTEQAQGMQFLYILTPFALLFAMWLFMKHMNPVLVLLFATLTATIAVSTVEALTGFPSYIAGVQGSILIVSILMPAAFWIYRSDVAFLPPPVPKPIITRIGRLSLIAGMLIILTGGLLAGLFLLMRWRTFQSDLDHIRTADPISELQELEFHYMPYFNHLENAEQANIIEAIRSQADHPAVALPEDEPQNNRDTFQPLALVLTDHQLHVFYWLGDDAPKPGNYISQAQVYSIMQACFDCAALRDEYHYVMNEVVYSMLNDLDYQGQYRMLSFAVDSDTVRNASVVRVGLQKILDWGGGATPFSFKVETLVSVPFHFEESEAFSIKIPFREISESR